VAPSEKDILYLWDDIFYDRVQLNLFRTFFVVGLSMWRVVAVCQTLNSFHTHFPEPCLNFLLFYSENVPK
jgi:hypothetical protein